jgi:hypothetical protein
MLSTCRPPRGRGHLRGGSGLLAWRFWRSCAEVARALRAFCKDLVAVVTVQANRLTKSSAV